MVYILILTLTIVLWLKKPGLEARKVQRVPRSDVETTHHVTASLHKNQNNMDEQVGSSSENNTILLLDDDFDDIMWVLEE